MWLYLSAPVADYADYIFLIHSSNGNWGTLGHSIYCACVSVSLSSVLICYSNPAAQEWDLMWIYLDFYWTFELPALKRFMGMIMHLCIIKTYQNTAKNLNTDKHAYLIMWHTSLTLRRYILCIHWCSNQDQITRFPIITGGKQSLPAAPLPVSPFSICWTKCTHSFNWLERERHLVSLDQGKKKLQVPFSICRKQLKMPAQLKDWL